MAYTTINKSTDYFNTKTWTGNGSTQTISGIGFQPDLVWYKNRSVSHGHRWQDSVRGVGNVVYSNATQGQDTGITNMITAYNSDGYALGADVGSNGSGSNYGSWNWKANGQGSANTDGSINTTYTSANTTAGFSIVKYTGTGSNATVGHGLGVAPKMIIAKRLTDAESWGVYHIANGTNKYMKLDETESAQTATSVWNDTAPTSSVFYLGTSGLCNGSGKDMIAYCFAEKTGYSKFGSYTGNGNVNGPFVYTGFKPAFVLLKESSGTDNWILMDNKRLGYNPRNEVLFPNLNNTEQAHDRIDLLSNGFKMNNDDGSINQSGQTYIYMAFGQSLVGSNNVPCTAR